MKRNLFLILLLAAVIGISGWYFKLKQPDSSTVNFELPENLPVASEATKDQVSEEAKENFAQKEILKSMAAEIISRPIMVSAPLAEADRKRAEGKLKEIVDLIQADYDNIYAWYDLGAYRRVIGDFEGAAEAWTFGTLIRPKDYIGFHNLGDLYGFYIKDYPKSEENYFKSIQNNPQNVQAYVDLATIYQSVYKEKANQAESILLRGLEANPANAGLRSILDRYRENGYFE